MTDMDEALKTHSSGEPAHIEVAVTLPEGMRVRVTVEALPPEGEAPASSEKPAGVVLLDQVIGAEQEGQPQVLRIPAEAKPAVPARRKAIRLSGREIVERTVQRLKAWPYSLANTLFGVCMLVYLLVRLIGLADFPIYFFTDEAVQTVMAADFLHDGLRNYNHEFLPTYFNRDATYNLSSVSVYLQVIPYIIFGKSVYVTRAVSVLVATFGAAALGLILRNIFKIRYWWSGVLLFSIAPAWFLHSRTAFETVEMVSFYVGFLYFYLLYRYHNPRYLYWALILGALVFYTYSPGQVLIVATGILLLISDLRYHWQNRQVGWRGVVLLVALALPYLRFYLANPGAPLKHLTTRAPFWAESIPLGEKLEQFASEYIQGLSPAYWFVTHDHDLARHLMKGYAHLLTVTFPFFVTGVVISLVKLRCSAHRAVLIALLASPLGSALVGIGITRALAYVVPAVLLMTLGLDWVLSWVEKWARRRKSSPEQDEQEVGGSLKTTAWVSIGLAGVLVVANFAMLRDALVNGPLWYQDYTLGGMQYGGEQVFTAVQDYLAENPGRQVIVSPSWTNGADAVAQFFLPEGVPVQLGSIDGYMFEHLNLRDNMVFVMIPSEFERMETSGKFKDISVDKIVPYPNGKPGFYFVRLKYADNVEAMLESEREQRRQLLTDTILIGDQEIQVQYSMLDMGTIQHIFDGNLNTVARTLEANPLVIELIFPEPRLVSGYAMTTGSAKMRIAALLYTSPDEEPLTYTENYHGSVTEPGFEVTFERSVMVSRLRFEIQEVGVSEPAHIHVWEIELR